MKSSHTLMHLPFKCFYRRKFRALFAKPVEFNAIKPEKVIIDREEKEKTSLNKPREVRWSSMKAEDNKRSLSKVVDIEKNYSFRHYSYISSGVTPVLFCADSSGEVLMVPRANIPHAI